MFVFVSVPMSVVIIVMTALAFVAVFMIAVMIARIMV